MPFHLDTAVLKSFLAIAETGNFTQAAAMVGRTQSALSLQIKRLEEGLGCALFVRSSRRVALTRAGEIFLTYARRILDVQWEAYSALREPDVEGEIRLGTPEDFATHYLPRVLAVFAQHHPRVRLNVACNLTLNLMSEFKKGAYDIVLLKRDPARVKGGTRVWREPLIWAAAEGFRADAVLPLVLSPEPCIYRARALSVLDRQRRRWRIAYTSPSLAGTIAAARAGMGVTVLPARMVPEGLHPVQREMKLPLLPDSEIALLRRPSLSRAAEMLEQHITQSLRGL